MECYLRHNAVLRTGELTTPRCHVLVTGSGPNLDINHTVRLFEVTLRNHLGDGESHAQALGASLLGAINRIG